jgi:glutamate--cysteine ligase
VPTPRRALTKDDARCVVAERCLTPTGRPRIGLELEFLSFKIPGFVRPSLSALEALTADLLPSGGRVTCEPGGQLEVSTPPQMSREGGIAATIIEVAALRARAAARGIELRAVGADRWRSPKRVIDSTRYRTMEAHFDTFGPAGREMMCNTAALQINIDTRPGNEHACWRAAHAIGPALVAAFANSPDESGFRSTRLATWLAMEPRRTRPVAATKPLPDAWVDYAFAAPTLVARAQDGTCIALPAPIPFEQWLDQGCAIGYPTVDDLMYHLTMLFPPVRPRGWLEIRYLDALPSPYWEAATTVVTALLDDAVLADAMRAVAGTETLWAAAAKYGLDDERLAEAADRCFALAIAATGDAGVADYLERFVSRRVPAWA